MKSLLAEEAKACKFCLDIFCFGFLPIDPRFKILVISSTFCFKFLLIVCLNCQKVTSGARITMS